MMFSKRGSTLAVLGVVAACGVGACLDEDRTSSSATCAGCGEAGASPERPAGETCAVPPTGPWTGQAVFITRGAGSSATITADVDWTQVASDGCVDRYQPSGAASLLFRGESSGPVQYAPISPSKGELIIDRRTSLMEYRMTGTVSFSDGFEIPWAHNRGTFQAAVISGEIDDFLDTIKWNFRRADAPASPLPDGECNGAPTERWTSETSILLSASASVTWTRVATDGCIDRFEPTGLFTGPELTLSFCPGQVFDQVHEVTASDGTLVVDRSAIPSRFQIVGDTRWEVPLVCLENGMTETVFLGGPWAFFSGGFEGDRFSAVAAGGFDPTPTYAWDLMQIH